MSRRLPRIVCLIILTALVYSSSYAFNVVRDPFAPLVKTQSLPTPQASNNAVASAGNNFTLKMVMWGGLKGALIEDSTGMPYVVKEGTKIGNAMVEKILPYKVILRTPNGIQTLVLKKSENLSTLGASNNKKAAIESSNKANSTEAKQ